MPNLSPLTRIDNDIFYLDLIGQIDEDADLSAILVTTPKAVINFDRVTFINSCGIRNWIIFVESIPAETEITYTHCPKIIIDQINMVKGFIPSNAKLKNFYAPYYCEACDNEEHILLTSDEVIDQRPPERRCSKCNEVQEFDALPSQYFSFLKTR